MIGPTILLFKGRGFLSTLIRWQTRSEFSHAALLLPDGRILEAWQGAGVRSRTLDDWKDVVRFSIKDITPAQWEAALSFAHAQVGLKYDYWSVIRFISRGKMPDNDKWFCSELVFAALESAGVHLLERINSWAVSPGLLSVSPLLTNLEPMKMKI